MTAADVAAEDPTMAEICDQTRTVDETMEYCAKRGLLANSSTCYACNTPRVIYKSNDNKTDGICWRCTGCGSRKSVRHGSFDTESHMSLGELLLFSYCWSEDCLQKFCAKEAGKINKSTAIDWANFHRYV